MDQTKITKLLRLMVLLTGNVSRTIDQLAKEMGVTTRTVYRYIDTIREAGFVVNKLYGNVYAMGKVARGLDIFDKVERFSIDRISQEDRRCKACSIAFVREEDEP